MKIDNILKWIKANQLLLRMPIGTIVLGILMISMYEQIKKMESQGLYAEPYIGFLILSFALSILFLYSLNIEDTLYKSGDMVEIINSDSELVVGHKYYVISHCPFNKDYVRLQTNAGYLVASIYQIRKVK